MPAPAVSEDILAEYSAGVDSPPPLPLSLKEARRQGYSGGGSLHAMLCGSWAVTGRVCVCSVDQLDIALPPLPPLLPPPAPVAPRLLVSLLPTLLPPLANLQLT